MNQSKRGILIKYKIRFFIFLDGHWRLYVNGTMKHIPRQATWGQQPVPGGGEVVLGQSSRSEETMNIFPTQSAFMGELGQVNIWKSALQPEKVNYD